MPDSPTPQADVLLVIATEVEAQAVFEVFTPGQKKQRHFIGDNTYYDLGPHGNARVFMVQSEMGSGGLAGMQATVQASIEALHPAAVVMVGIAFGVNPKKQKIGDILVSRQLMSYELQRVGMDKSGKQTRIPRNDRAHASVKLVDRFTSGKKDWHGQTVEIGLILSGEKLVDNLEFRQQLLEFEPEAIGGEMEGAGLYAAAQRAKVDWILVKAICDWAEHKGRGKEQRQQLAARHAASFVLHVIQQGGLARQPSPPKSLAPRASKAKNQTPIGPNPFGDVGRITDPKRFFDREELLRQIFEELGKGVNLSLVGESQIGKSSALSMICALGPERLSLPSETFVYLSLEVVESEDEFYTALCDALHIAPCRGYSLTRALRGKRYVLCLDEVEKMTWKGFTARVRSHLRGLADGSDAPLKLIIASRSPLSHLFPDSPALDSPLAGICHQLDIGPFPPDVVRAFLAHRLGGTGMRFRERDIATLLREAGGHPTKLQRAAADLYRMLTLAKD